ncbi:ribosome-inactivating family protein [Kitasatospora sp. NPDC018619]|uniref:ribosome-inactivating family protein n=1 Tax=unclassified Kitasatospora TaxID=2633591 RepID=UPI003799DEE8
MKRHSTVRARLRSVLLAGVGLSLALTGVLGGAGTAQAFTGWHRMSHVWFDLSEYGPSGDQRIAYSNFLASLRAAVAAPSLDRTQGENVGLVMVSLTAPDDRGRRRHLDLWVNPSNLYVWGFTNENGVTYQFNDIDNALRDRLAETNTPAPQINPAIQTLPFGSNYNSLTQAAGRDRNAMPISFTDLRYSIVQLAGENNPWGDSQATARSLSLMIQAVAEAARFNDVEGTFRAVMNGWDVRTLPIEQQWLENNWDALSRLDVTLHGDEPAANPLWIPEVGLITNRTTLRRYVRMTMSVPHADNGDWSHDEL